MYNNIKLPFSQFTTYHWTQENNLNNWSTRNGKPKPGPAPGYREISTHLTTLFTNQDNVSVSWYFNSRWDT